MSIVVTVQSNLIRINYVVIILCSNYLHWARVSFSLFFLYIFGYHFIFQTVFQRCRTCYSGTELEYITVGTFEFVCISGDIRARANKGHISNQYIPQSR